MGVPSFCEAVVTDSSQQILPQQDTIHAHHILQNAFKLAVNSGLSAIHAVMDFGSFNSCYV